MKKALEFLQNNKYKWIAIGVLIAIILFIVFWNIQPTYHGEERMVKIEKNLGSDETAQKLKNEQLIRDKWLFVLYVWLRGYNSHLQAGEYILNPQMNLFEISDIIAFGKTSPNSVKITIPEGWRNQQIEERLIAYGVLKSGDKLPQEKEGYLFPDTYYFEKDSNIDAVAEKMYDNFLRRIGEGISKNLLADSSMKLPNAVIMASIIEKEVKGEEDMAIVSGIFWKRIKNDIPLQSCATIAYILGVEKKQYTYEDTRVKSSYNTYTNLGLPPTPINNPGLAAIKAALYPKETDYLFFLSDPATGKTIFSKTLEEHNKNKAKYLED